MAEAVVVGAVVGAVFNVGLEKFLGVIKMAARCESDCIKLLSYLEKHRPKLERIEIQLRNRNGEPLEALEEWLAESKEIMQLAKLVVQEGLSGSKPVRKFSLFGNRDLVKRIQEVRGKINELANGMSATTAILSTALATTNPAANTVCTHQLHHCCSSPGLMQAPSPTVAWSDHASHSLPPLRTTYSPSSLDPFMSQHSSPVSGHGTPGSSSVYSDCWGQQSPAPGSANTWDFPGRSRLDHHMHSRSEEVVSVIDPELGQTQGMYRRHSADHFDTTCPGSRQWSDEVAGFQDAERRTREAQSHHRRHSIANSPQSSEPVTSYPVKAPSPTAWSHHASHSLPPLRTTYSSSSLDPAFMSQHSSPVSGHGTPGPSSSSSSVTYLDCWSQQSPAPGSANSWDAPGSSRLQHSRSEEVVGTINPELEQTQGLYSVDRFGTSCYGSQQWFDEVVRSSQDAERWTRESQSHHRRHSIANTPQSSEPVTSYAPSAPPLHSAPSEARMYSPVDLLSL